MTTTRKIQLSIVTLFALAALAASPAHAQDLNFGTLDDDTHVVTVTTGAEHGLVLGTGYARSLSIADQPVVLGAEVTLGWAEVDVGDYRLRAGALVPLVGGRHWKVIAGVSAIVRGTENDLSRMTNVGTDVSILAGRYARRGFVAVEAGYDWQLATHVSHSDEYRMLVFEEARDGWYGTPGGVIRAGLQAGVSFGRHDLVVRAGRMIDDRGKAPLLPFYGTLGFDTRW